MKDSPKAISIPVEQLHFDRANPRLAEYGIRPESTDEDILDVLWDAMDVRELVQSIAASGFFQHEALIVSNDRGKKVVIEGNRRLAAVRVLLNPRLAQERGLDLKKIDKKVLHGLKALPAIISSRNESWRYLGFKHVNGPAKWSSYAKAKYIADVHREYKIPLDDIADQIGDRHNTVQRLYRGLMVIEQAERQKVYDREDRFRQRFAFSHLYTGIDYEGISSFLGLRSADVESRNPVPKKNIKRLGEFCIWLYGSKSENIPPLVERQNPDLRNFDAALRSKEAIAALRAGADLNRAFELSRPPSTVLEESLLAAKRELTTARAYLTTGYDKSEELLRLVGTIAEMAEDIYTEMDRKRNTGQKRRLTEG